MTRKMVFLPTFFIITILLAACSAGWTTFQSQDLGLKVDLPENWVLRETPGTLTITSSPDVLDNETIVGEAGVTIALANADQFSGMSTDPKDILAAFIAFYLMEGNSPDIVQEGEPELFQIKGQQAASATYSGNIEGEEGVFTATVIVKGEKFVLVLGADGSADNSHAKTIDKIIKSVVID